jgi:DNA helicase IV
VNLLEQQTAETLAAMDDEVAVLLGVDVDAAVGDDLRSLGLDGTDGPGDPEVDWDGIREELLDDAGVDRAVERVWPRLDSAGALRRFLGDPAALGAGPDLRPEPGDGTWTPADLALLDEARALIDGPPERVYGHIVVDEAQELSEMQWRMLMRRCPSRSLTVVGDFAQAGSATTVRSWADAVGPFVGDRFEHHTLTVNYRTTAEILEAAAPLLARIAPEQPASRSVRHGERVRTVTGADLGATVCDLVGQAAEVRPDELVGVIAPAARATALSALLDRTGAVVVAAPDARGLEFDSVIVVDPTSIEAARSGGSRDLYVALTRATKRVVIVEPR